MNDIEFIELLNLYLDHEISGSDARRLEAEVTTNPARRKIYRQYCQMHKGCSLLAQSTAAEEIAAPTESKVLEFGGFRSSWTLGNYATALCAAAACIALIVVMRNGNSSGGMASLAPESSVIASVQFTPASNLPKSTRDLPRTVSVTSRTSELQPVFVAYSMGANPQPNTPMATGPIDPRFDWMQRVQVTSMQRIGAEELRFENKVDLTPDKGALRIRRPIDAQFEQAAHQFQR